MQEAISLFLTLKNTFWLILYHKHYYTNMHNVSKLQSIENIETMTYSLEIQIKHAQGNARYVRIDIVTLPI